MGFRWGVGWVVCGDIVEIWLKIYRFFTEKAVFVKTGLGIEMRVLMFSLTWGERIWGFAPLGGRAHFGIRCTWRL